MGVADGKDAEGLSIAFSHLGLKTNCPEPEWRPQFDAVKTSLTRCLGLKEIRLPDRFKFEDDTELEAERASCHLSKVWDSCWHFLDGLNCIDADYKSIVVPETEMFPFAHGPVGFESELRSRLELASDEDIKGLSGLTDAFKLRCRASSVNQIAASELDQEWMANEDWMMNDEDGELPKRPRHHDLP